MEKYKRKFNESIPTELTVGEKYKTKDGGSIEIVQIYIAGFHKSRPDVMIIFDWVSPEGKEGQSTNSVEALKKNYF